MSYGFKLHIIHNLIVVSVDFIVTKGNVDNRKLQRGEHFISKLYGTPFWYKGYILKNSLLYPFSNGIYLMNKLGKNMKTKPDAPFIRCILLEKKDHDRNNI